MKPNIEWKFFLRPSDEFLHKQLESENTSDIEVGEIDGMMTSFYKVCTKTATGVFSNTLNTIKTALPGGGVDSGYSVELWKIKPQQDVLYRLIIVIVWG